MKPDQELMFAWATWWSQVLGTGFAGLSVGLAALFGFLTLRATKAAQRANAEAADANERANLAATGAPSQTSSGSAQLSGSGNLTASGEPGPAPAQVRWTAEQRPGETWLLNNRGSVQALQVQISGLTTMDNRRLQFDDDSPRDVPPMGTVEFRFTQRLSASGPGALVVRWSEPDDGDVTRLQRVPLNPS